MGQFEKIVVLLSFFLVTVILVISFSSDEEKPFPMGPSAEVAAAGPENPGDEAPDPSSPAVSPEGDREAPSGPGRAGRDGDPRLLSLQARRDREAAAAAQGREQEVPDLLLDTAGPNRAATPAPAATLPRGAALITLEGLEDTFEEDIKEYVWQRGDDFVSVARKLYGDAEKAGLLWQFNEDFTYEAPSEKILVPVYDLRSAGDRAALDRGGAGAAPASLAAGSPYVVVEGDSLWVISKKVYGRGALWEKIFEANRDQLESPDDLTLGQTLKIP